MKPRNRWGEPLRSALTLVAILASAAGADTFSVTRTDDPAPDGCLPADCSLREAVIDANGNGLADTITLPAGNYTLAIPGRDEDAAATGDLDLTEDVAIEGAGTRTTVVDGGSMDRIVEVLSGALVSISDLTIRNGLPDGWGGGLRHNSGDLTLTRCRIADNITTGFGGGLYGRDVVRVVESVLVGNTANRGGGILQDSGSTLFVVNSTISGNMATDFGGGLMSSGSSTVVDLRNVTISGNIADSDDDGIGDFGGVHVANGGSVEMTHTVVAGNFDLGGEIPDCNSGGSNLIVSGGYNLIGNTTGCSPSGDETGNLYDLDPLLSPLASNGGPTDTHALLSGSPAIDAGNPAGCVDEAGAPLTADQRGEVRPSDGDGDMVPICDMGAYEVGGLIFNDGFESGDISAWSSAVP